MFIFSPSGSIVVQMHALNLMVMAFFDQSLGFQRPVVTSEDDVKLSKKQSYLSVYRIVTIRDIFFLNQKVKHDDNHATATNIFTHSTS